MKTLPSPGSSSCELQKMSVPVPFGSVRWPASGAPFGIPDVVVRVTRLRAGQVGAVGQHTAVRQDRRVHRDQRPGVHAGPHAVDVGVAGHRDRRDEGERARTPLGLGRRRCGVRIATAAAAGGEQSQGGQRQGEADVMTLRGLLVHGGGHDRPPTDRHATYCYVRSVGFRTVARHPTSRGRDDPVRRTDGSVVSGVGARAGRPPPPARPARPRPAHRRLRPPAVARRRCRSVAARGRSRPSRPGAA